ncbi:MAG: hypothetical protein IJ210_15285 [Clostridia bacterium]|nr:hypothetical protein [Clostridia bacterium]
MPRLFKEFNHAVALQAVTKCLEDKWRRNDVRTYIEEWAGYSRYELLENELENGYLSRDFKQVILESLACSTEDMVIGIQHGIDPDFDPVSTHKRVDGVNGKVRDIAYLCIRHQVLGHAVKIGLEPLLKARLLPSQHASIPKHGQTALARQIRRMLNRKLGIKMFVKTDCTSAYESTAYDACIRLIQKEIPRAKLLIACLRVLEKYAPGGHLIIGGYLDAWLFNFAMSYGLRYILSLRKSRRGNKYPLVIRAVSYMDDLLLLGSNRTALKQAIEQLKAWLWATYHIKMRTTTDVIRLYSLKEEKEHRHKETPAKRSVPMIDMGGYKIAHGFITIRRKNMKRIIRTFDRAWTEYRETGTVKRQRACQIVSRNGMIANSWSYQFSHAHHVYRLMRIARKVQGYWSREDQRKRKEKIADVVQRHRKQRASSTGCCVPAS